MPQYNRNAGPGFAGLLRDAVARIASHGPETPEHIRAADHDEVQRLERLHSMYLQNKIRNKR